MSNVTISTRELMELQKRVQTQAVEIERLKIENEGSAKLLIAFLMACNDVIRVDDAIVVKLSSTLTRNYEIQKAYLPVAKQTQYRLVRRN